jgi:hypothetical protein
VDAAKQERLWAMSAGLPPALRRALRCHLLAFGELRHRRLVLAAVRRDGRWLEHACPTHRDDPEVVLAACRSVFTIYLRHASERLRADPGFVIRQLGLAQLQGVERKPLYEALLLLEESRKLSGHLLTVDEVFPGLRELERKTARHRIGLLMQAGRDHGYSTFADPGKVRTAAKRLQSKFPEFTLAQIERAIVHDWDPRYVF